MVFSFRSLNELLPMVLFVAISLNVFVCIEFICMRIGNATLLLGYVYHIVYLLNLYNNNVTKKNRMHE